MLKKKCLLILAIFLVCNANATKYYVSGTGLDTNPGTSTSFPFKTLTKVNSFFASMAAGDTLYFHKGETFVGGLIPGRAGTPGHPMYISSYGTGANPIITGFATVTSWANLGGNIWESSAAVSTLASLNIVVIDGVNTAMGRTPDSGWMTYQTFSTNTSITSSDSRVQSGTTNWTGAEVVIKKLTNVNFRGAVTGHSGGTLTYSGGGDNGQNNWGFFIQNDARTLTANNEWFYNTSTKKIRIFSTSSPGNVKVPTVDITCSAGGNRHWITIDGVDFQGANSFGIKFASDSNVTIKNCNISFTGSDGIQTTVCSNLLLQGNTVQNTNNNAIYVNAFESPVGTFQGHAAHILNNFTFRCGLLDGMLDNSLHRTGWGIRCESSDAVVMNNVVDSCGFMGIHFDGNNTQVKNNFVNWFCLTLNDGGGIYTYNNGTTVHTYTGRVIEGNIVSNGIGNPAGTNSTAKLVDGIYMDDRANNVRILNNAASACSRSGYFLHNANFCGVIGNISYDNLWQIYIQQDINPTVHDDTLKNNIFFAKTATQLCFRYLNVVANSIFNLGVADNNYYARPVDDNLTINTSVSGTPTNYSLASWKTASSMDASSNKSPITAADTSKMRYYFDSALINRVVSLGANYKDVANTVYPGTVTLTPFTAKAFIFSSPLTNIAPTANAGTDQVITLPTSSTGLSGTVGDADGTVVSQVWTQISGPNTATFDDPTILTPTISGLIAGVYIFQLQSTDNFGATGSDMVQITVVPATNISPVASAGPDQTITVSSATMDGTGSTDSDGTIVAYSWSKISGPGATTITHPTDQNPVMSNLENGVYVFQVQVTDNDGAQATDTVQITVNLPVPPPSIILFITHGKIVIQ